MEENFLQIMYLQKDLYQGYITTITIQSFKKIIQQKIVPSSSKSYLSGTGTYLCLFLFYCVSVEGKNTMTPQYSSVPLT